MRLDYLRLDYLRVRIPPENTWQVVVVGEVDGLAAVQLVSLGRWRWTDAVRRDNGTGCTGNALNSVAEAVKIERVCFTFKPLKFERYYTNRKFEHKIVITVSHLFVIFSSWSACLAVQSRLASPRDCVVSSTSSLEVFFHPPPLKRVVVTMLNKTSSSSSVDKLLLAPSSSGATGTGIFEEGRTTSSKDACMTLCTPARTWNYFCPRVDSWWYCLTSTHLQMVSKTRLSLIKT